MLPADGGGLAASLTMMAETDHLLIWSVAVDPALRGRGLGRRLMAVAEDLSRQLGYAS